MPFVVWADLTTGISARIAQSILKDCEHTQKDCIQTCTEMIINVVGFNQLPRKNRLGKLVLEVVNFPTERYVRSLVKDSFQLFVTIGTIVGLYTGASLITLLEIIHMFIVRK